MKKLITVALVILVLIAALMIFGNAKMSSADITYDGTTIKWDAPFLSDSFEVSINGATAVPVDVEEYNYTPTEKNFKISITVHKKLSFLLKSHTVEKSFIGMDVINDLQYEGGLLKWAPVEGAASYMVEVSKNGTSEIKTATTTEFPYAEPGTVSFRVKPVGNSTEHYSVWGAAYQATILSAPTNISYDDAMCRIVWNTDSGVGTAGYVVKINNVEVDTVVQRNYYDYVPENILQGAQFTISVKAVGTPASRVFDSAFSAEKTYGYLPSVDSSLLEIKQGVMTWPAVENAHGYRVRIDYGTPVDVTTNSFACNTGNINNIQIIPFNNSGTFFSTWSQPVNRYIPQAPVVSISTFTNEETLITWIDNAIASGYLGELKKDGQVIKSRTELTFSAGTGGKTEYKDAFSEVGVYEFRLLATTDAGVESKWSEPVIITRLPAPTSYEIRDDIKEKGSSTQIRFSPVVSAKNYTVSFTSEGSNDVPLYTNLSSSEFVLGELRDSNSNLINGKVITVHVMANSYAKTAGKEIYLGSAAPLNISVQKLAVPENFRINEHKAKWDAVTGSNGYIISINNDRNEEIVRQYVGAGITETTLNIAESGTYFVTVRAMGNGSDVISSDPTADACRVTKLPAPNNVRINGGILTWTPVSGAEGYYIKIGENIIANNLNVTEYDLYDLATLSAQSVTVYALGNGGDATQTTLDSASSAPLSFQKLATPVSVYIDNTEIRWAAVTNAVGYEIYLDGFKVADVSNQISYSHETLIKTTGVHRVKILAVGNQTTSSTSVTAYFDSDFTGEVSVEKLTAPTLATADGSNAITWTANTKASGVQVVFNSSTFNYNATTTSYTLPQITAQGTYPVQIRFVGNEQASLSQAGTISSEVTQFTFTAKQLAKPTVSASLSADNSCVILSVTNYDSYAYKYMTKWIFNNGSNTERTIENGEISYTFDNVATGTASYKVQAKGGFFYNDGTSSIYFIESTFSDAKTVVKLSQVKRPTLGLGSTDATRTVTFTANTTETVNIKEYIVTVTYSNGETRTYTTNGTSVEIDWFAGHTVTRGEIVAVGKVDASGNKIVVNSDPTIFNS